MSVQGTKVHGFLNMARAAGFHHVTLTRRAAYGAPHWNLLQRINPGV
jgi:hypothetical protein